MSSTTPGRDTGGFRPARELRVMRSRTRGFFPEPVAAKVPEITLLFWVIKILTTAGGEATSDYLALDLGSRLEAGCIEAAIFGTGVADALHLFVGIPYAGTTVLWAVVLAVIFWLWDRSEHTLSIHSIFTQRREMYYWAVVFATFALGTALGDFTAMALHLGYLASGIMFFVIILIPAVAWSRFGLNPVVAFWFAYVVTRPLGASFADYFSKPHSLSGANYGDATVAVITTLLVAALVGYLSVTRRDIQPRQPQEAGRFATVRDDAVGR